MGPSGLAGDHAGAAGIFENPAGIYDRARFAEGFEGIDVAGGGNRELVGIEIDFDNIAGSQNFTESLFGFDGVEFAGSDAIAKENSGETFGNDCLAPGRSERDGRVFAGAATSKIAPGNDNWVRGFHLCVGHVALRVGALGQPGQGVAAQFDVFFGNRRDQVEVLGGNDLVGVNVVPHHIDRAADSRAHGANPMQKRASNQPRSPAGAAGKPPAERVDMPQYSDPENLYTLEYPEGWLPLTHEGSPHVSLASLETGGYLKIEAYLFDPPITNELRPERALGALIECEQRQHPRLSTTPIQLLYRDGMAIAYTSFSRAELPANRATADFGHVRAWVFTRGNIQVRCLYRCRRTDAQVDDDDLHAITGSLTLTNAHHLDATSFTRYYYSLLKRRRPQLVSAPPDGLSLTLADGQTVLLEHLFNHYLQEPERMDDLIESHIALLDFCGDDVPDLTNFKMVRPLLFPKIFRHAGGALPAHRTRLWPGLALGAVIQGTVFNYGVNQDRLKAWGVGSLAEIRDDLMANLYKIPPVAPRGLRDEEGSTRAISYVDHPFAASFILFADFYDTTAHNLQSEQFLVGLPDPSCVSCFREDDPRFVVQHTAMLRWDYHRSVEKLTDTIYLVTGPEPRDVKPYDILHCCVKKA